MRLLAALVVTAALLPSTARAQPAPWEPERLTPGWVFTPSIVVGGLWDSNVTLRAVNEPVYSQWVGLLNPRGEIDFNGRRTHLNLGYSGALEAYRQFSELNRYEQRGRFELRHQATPHLGVTAHAGYARVPTTDRLELDPGVLPFLGIGSEHADASAGFHLATSPRTTVEGELRYQTITFDRNEITDPQDLTRYLRSGNSISPEIGVMHGVTERVSIGGSWNYRHADVGNGQAIYDVHSTTAEVAWQPAEHTTVRGGAGISYLTAKTQDLTKWGPAYHLGLDHHIGRLALAAKYERAFVPSIGFGGLNANQRLSGSAHIPFAGGRAAIGGNVAYGQIEPVDLLGVNFTLNSLWTQGTVSYQLARWLRTEAFVNRTHQTSTARGLVDRTRVGIEFVTSKPVRIQ